MIFWICVLLTIGLTILSIWLNDRCSDLDSVTIFFALINFIVSSVMIFIIFFNNCNIDGKVAELNVRYDSLVYQYENDIYDNDNDIGKRELMVDIQEWNEMIANNQEKQDNFWIGIFTPNIYDQFEFIELDR